MPQRDPRKSESDAARARRRRRPIFRWTRTSPQDLAPLDAFASWLPRLQRACPSAGLDGIAGAMLPKPASFVNTFILIERYISAPRRETPGSPSTPAHRTSRYASMRFPRPLWRPCIRPSASICSLGQRMARCVSRRRCADGYADCCCWESAAQRRRMPIAGSMRMEWPTTPTILRKVSSPKFINQCHEWRHLSNRRPSELLGNL